MTFSFIIPVYNTAEYLDECVQSILSQSYNDYEIILVDDGSNDGSGQMCDKYSEEFSRIKVIHQKNAGLSVARNTGIKNASGEYFILADSDDFCLEIILERLRQHVGISPTWWCIHISHLRIKMN